MKNNRIKEINDWKKRSTCRVLIQLNRENDRDIILYLENSDEKKNALFKRLVRQEIEKSK